MNLDHTNTRVLNSAVAERKAAMLDELRGELRRRRTTRRATRAGVALLVVVAGGTLAWIAAHPVGSGSGVPSPRIAQGPSTVQIAPPTPASVVTAPPLPSPPTPASPAARPSIVITSIETDRSVLARWSAPAPTTRLVQEIDDDQLVQLSRDAGQPVGLIRANGRVLAVEEGARDGKGGARVEPRTPPTAQHG